MCFMWNYIRSASAVVILYSAFSDCNQCLVKKPKLRFDLLRPRVNRNILFYDSYCSDYNYMHLTFYTLNRCCDHVIIII